MFIGDTIDAIPDRVIQRLLKAFQHADGSDSVTYDQYMALLDAHCSDTAVVAVLEDWDRGSVGLDRSSGMSDGRHMLRVFRSGSRFLYSDPAGDDVSKSIVSCFCGFLHADLCAVCHLEEDKSGNESIGAWGRKTQRLVDVVHLRCEALHTLHEITSNVYGMSMHRNAASDSGWSMGDILGAADSQSGSVGDAVSAMCTLDNAVHGAKSSFSADTGAVSKSTLAELISDRLAISNKYIRSFLCIL